MFLHVNEAILKKNFTHLWNNMHLTNSQWKIEHLTPIITKSGLPSLFMEEQGQTAYLHSKYDPVNEAEQWIKKYEEQIEQLDHVFFYGIGFGYHIEYFLENYPNKLFTLYEPNPFIFKEYIKSLEIKKNFNNIRGVVYIENESLDIELTIHEILERFQYECTIIIHPVYERIFQNQTKQFFALFKQLISKRQSELIFLTEATQLITLNSINNFRKVLNTPNILKEKKSYFKGKPVLIVAAGPSLEEEFENIRLIKEQGLAYIFAVGSANKALLSAKIYPDAICSYDPYEINIQVFEIILKENISQIPLIFGSSIAHSVVAFYPGPMLHFISNRDNISKHYLAQERILENNEFISDAPFVSIITLDLLQKLGCEFIIFAGQNFALKDEQYYSKGITNQHLTNEFAEFVKGEEEYVESVEGKQILSMKSFSIGRVELEHKIALFKNITFINTTKGGAKIKGTQFLELEKVISERLNQKIVDENWYKADNTNYNIENIIKQSFKIKKHFEKIPDQFTDITQTLITMEKYINSNFKDKLEKLIDLLINQMKQLNDNVYFTTFIESELHFQTILLMKTISKIQYSTDLSEKSKMIVEAYSKYLNECQNMNNLRSNLFLQFQKHLMETIK